MPVAVKKMDLFEVPILSQRNEVTHSAESYTGLYGMHKYWGKKPFNIMASFIKKYTSESEVVLDPFLGSGVSVSEAVFNNRKAIGIDINPCAVLIAEQVINLCDIEKATIEFKKIQNNTQDKIHSFYKVKRGDKEFIGENFLWEKNKLTEIRYTDGARKRLVDVPSDDDLFLSGKISYSDIQLFYPTNSFFHNSRINAKRENKIYDLFTPRNLYALSLIREEIEKIKDNKIKDFLLFCFTASLGQASKMVFVIKRRNKTKDTFIQKEKKEVGSWVIGYWMPKDFFENNVWTCFETRFKKIIKAKKEQAKAFNKVKQGHSLEETSQSDYVLINRPAQNAIKDIAASSVDYILTDPPHGNRIPYLELSMLWNSWLKKEVNYEDEIIISESKDRSKDVSEYNRLMYSVFSECHRVLKNGKHLSFMFNSLDDESWIHSIEMFYKIGFELVEIETLGYSANSVVQDNRKNGLQTDFILTYKKSLNGAKLKTLKIISLSSEKETLKKIKSLRSIGYKSFQIMNNIISDLLKEGKFIRVSELLKEISNG